MLNDYALTIGIAVAAVGILAVLAYNAIHGVHGSLTNAKVGEVYNFEYEQPYHGDPQRVLAKVLEPVCTLDDGTIRNLNMRSQYRRNDPNFKRTKHLVTCEMPNGEIRNFYAERAKNVRRTFIPGRFIRTAAAAIL